MQRNCWEYLCLEKLAPAKTEWLEKKHTQGDRVCKDYRVIGRVGVQD